MEALKTCSESVIQTMSCNYYNSVEKEDHLTNGNECSLKEQNTWGVIKNVIKIQSYYWNCFKGLYILLEIDPLILQPGKICE